MIYSLLQIALFIPVAGGSVFCLLCVWAAAQFMGRGTPASTYRPPVTVLKPIYGLDKDLEQNLLSLCRQDYPDYQIVFAVQRSTDPALPILRKLATDYSDRVTLVLKESPPVVNGKVQNLTHALEGARHDVLIISDSDARVAPNYIADIVAPLEDTKVGYVCTLYRSFRADHWWERLELLSLNADFVPALIFSYVTGASNFLIGATVAFRRTDLEATGGMAALGDYLVEDYEMGKRLVKLGKRMVFVPHIVDLVADYPQFNAWWHHQVYWDQNTWAANPVGFALTILTRSVPFALLFAAVRGFDTIGFIVFLAALAIRMGSAALISGRYLKDHEGVTALWLLPIRDLFALVSWYIALTRRTFVWRGHKFGLTKEGRIVPRDVDNTTASIAL